MAIQPGSTLLHYRVVDKLGEGGMGVVWKGIDTSLDRHVAIKVLPEAFAGEAERMARFEREAKVLASLSHPNIAAIYGLHEQDGVRFLAMELVAGEDLSDRIDRGPMAPDQALGIGLEIARALEAAHAAGVVHRDLKPANVRVSPDGKVKVLDFGLAKAMPPDSATGSADPSLSPTMTAAGSVAGMILGTAAYMSPEQARGQSADARADVWAFGVVLFEMLTGKRLFEGATVSDVLASVLKSDPTWTDLPAGTPAGIRRLLRRCLAKDPEHRLHHIADARLELEDALAGAESGDAGAPAALPAATPARGVLPWALAALALGVAGLTMWLGRPASTAGPGPVMSLSVPLPSGAEVVNEQAGSVAISPTGQHLAVVAYQDGIRKLFLRALDEPGMILLDGTENAQGPFFSPDGRWLAFIANDQLKKVPVDGGNPIVVDSDFGSFRGASWGDGDIIVFTPTNATSLFSVPGNGGPRTPVTTLDTAASERTHRWPQVLPGGDVVLFTVGYLDSSENYENSPIDAVRLSTGERTRVLQGASFGRYVESGHLVFARGGPLFAVPFDLDTLETRGTEVPVLEGVMGARNSGLAQMDVSATGILAFVPGTQAGIRRRLLWASGDDRIPLDAPADAYSDPQVSPDGREVAFTLLGGVSMNVWIHNIEQRNRRRLTFSGSNFEPIWSPDGEWVAFTSDRDGYRAVYRKRADNSRDAELLVGVAGRTYRPTSWSPDGSLLTVTTGPVGSDIMVFSTVDRTLTEFLATDASEGAAKFSPNGQFIAYNSNESRQDEVYVRPYPGPGGKWQISTNGGYEPYWSKDGSKIFYRDIDGSIWATDVERDGAGLRPTRTVRVVSRYQQLYTGDEGAVYSPDPSGERFLLVNAETEGDAATDRVGVIVNWFEAIRRRMR